MSFSKISELEKLSKNKIEEQILEIKKDIINLKIKQATKQQIKSHIFKHKKHTLAQLLMLEKKIIQKEIE